MPHGPPTPWSGVYVVMEGVVVCVGVSVAGVGTGGVPHVTCTQYNITRGYMKGGEA